MKESWYTYKTIVLFETPYIAPSLSPNKAMKKLQIQDILKCYDDDYKELAEHIDKAFQRDAQCNILIPGHIFSAALRRTLNKNDIVVRGAITLSKDSVRIGTVKVNDSLLVYEYIVPGVVVSTIFQINTIVPSNVTVYIGARKYKGYGRTKLTFQLLTSTPS